uniref:exodeoxyribonuclease III n=1 Tax=Pygocentrus nattereri TaxID=42514 RepID=A0AAR2JMC4_PYGNA
MQNAPENSSRKGLGLTFTSWNVRGVNDPVKRRKVLTHLKSLSSDVIFLQETHLKRDFHIRLRFNWVGQVYHSSFSAKARGVAILIRKGVLFKHHSTIADKQGRYIIVTGELQSIPVTLLNVYGPNYDSPDFFRKVTRSYTSLFE